MGLLALCEVARRAENKAKNRYGNIVACESFLINMSDMLLLCSVCVCVMSVESSLQEDYSVFAEGCAKRWSLYQASCIGKTLITLCTKAVPSQRDTTTDLLTLSTSCLSCYS